MKKNILIILVMSAISLAATAQKETLVKEIVTVEEVIVADSVAAATEAGAEKEELRFDQRSGFTWGLDLGSSVDMSGRDMTYAEIDACFGYRTPGIALVGLGASIGVMTTNSSRVFPVYALVRTSFSTRPRLVFMELRTGISYNEIYKDTQWGFYGNLGIGFKLATSRSFAAHIILSYNLVKRHTVTTIDEDNFVVINRYKDIHLASLRLGVTF